MECVDLGAPLPRAPNSADLGSHFIENESLKKTYEHNCLPLINKWVSEIKMEICL